MRCTTTSFASRWPMSSDLRRRRTTGLLPTVAAAMTIAAGACADFERGLPLPDIVGAPGDGGQTGDSGARDGAAPGPSFVRDVHPLLLDGCGRCHSPNGQADDSALVLMNDPARDHEAVLSFVNRENPAASRLLSKGAGTGHVGGAIYAATTPEYQTILEWIKQGSAP
jgi:hypothetical protein